MFRQNLECSIKILFSDLMTWSVRLYSMPIVLVQMTRMIPITVAKCLN